MGRSKLEIKLPSYLWQVKFMYRSLHAAVIQITEPFAFEDESLEKLCGFVYVCVLDFKKL